MTVLPLTSAENAQMDCNLGDLRFRVRVWPCVRVNIRVSYLKKNIDFCLPTLLSAMSKRARVIRAPAARRPIDKTIVRDVLTTVDGTQQSVLITEATIPCTVTGLRWSLSGLPREDQNTGTNTLHWAIVLVKEGNTANDLPADNNLGSLYEPEQNVLAWGNGSFILRQSTNDHYEQHWRDTSKTMRKLMAGDRIELLVRATGGGLELHVATAVQMFCKY